MGNISKQILILVAIVAMIISSCGGSAKPAADGDVEDQSDAQTGELLFTGQAKADVDCASCHDNDDGDAPDLATVVNDLSDEEILKAMEEGKGSMPGFSALLLEKEQQQILACLRARFNSPETTVTTEEQSQE